MARRADCRDWYRVRHDKACRLALNLPVLPAHWSFLALKRNICLPSDPLPKAESRRAILVNNDSTLGLTWMFETFRDTRGEKDIRVFRNLVDTLAWVLDRNTGA